MVVPCNTSLRVNLASATAFSPFTLTAPAARKSRASRLLATNGVVARKSSNATPSPSRTPAAIEVLVKSCVTSANKAASSARISPENSAKAADFARATSDAPWIISVAASANAFCAARSEGFAFCAASNASMVARSKNVNQRNNFPTSSSDALSQNW